MPPRALAGIVALFEVRFFPRLFFNDDLLEGDSRVFLFGLFIAERASRVTITRLATAARASLVRN